MSKSGYKNSQYVLGFISDGEPLSNLNSQYTKNYITSLLTLVEVKKVFPRSLLTFCQQGTAHFIRQSFSLSFAVKFELYLKVVYRDKYLLSKLVAIDKPLKIMCLWIFYLIFFFLPYWDF